MNNRFIHSSVSKQALNSFFNSNLELENEIHTIEVYKNNELLLRYAPSPYDCSDKCEVYSLSKSFTSTAIGLVVDGGLLSVEDRVIDIFPDKVPVVISDNLAMMQVKHLLSMNTGHGQCVMPQICHSDDGVSAFLSQDVSFIPGSHFAYNTGASFMLSAIIERITGYSLLDYLSLKLFCHMGIENIYWSKCGGGICQGGTGITISCDDIAKLGLLYINNGVYHGKRLLSEDWTKTASSFHSDNSTNGTPDWQSGYGYQFWLNHKEGYRGDGAYGQICLIIPNKGIVVAISAEVSDMQGEMNTIFEFVDNLENKQDSNAEQQVFSGYAPLEQGEVGFTFDNEYFTCNKNPMGITWVATSIMNETLKFRFSDGTLDQTILAGNGFWIENKIIAKMMKPKLTTIMVSENLETIRFSACYRIENDTIYMQWRHRNTPHKETVILKIVDHKLEVDFAFKNELLHKDSQHLVGKLRI